MRIRGIDNLTLAEIQDEIYTGGRFVVFEWCLSLLIVTLRRPTDVYFLRADQSGFLQGLPYTLLSFLLGWWGIPWGLIYTPMAIYSNLSGGRDVTAQVSSFLRTATDVSPGFQN